MRRQAVTLVVALGLAPLAVAAGLGTMLDPSRLPLGDGKVSTSAPQAGWVFVCGRSPGGHGEAGRAKNRTAPTWIRSDGTWDATAKPIVDGAVAWPRARARITRTGNRVTVVVNGLPVGHLTGVFPIAPSDDAYAFDPNPNRIREVALRWTLPRATAAARPSCLPMGAIGVAANGVALYNALDADWKDALANETQDACDGHPARSGQYHYHSIPACLTRAEAPNAHSPVVGWALDGFAIAGPRGDGGVLLTNADLDLCHGHTGPLATGGSTRSVYHYHATAEYPYTLGCFRGTPVRAGAAATASARP